ncbi:MAG: hypothetical protein XD82_1183 [Methanoculleus marisnigri]|uniref:Uncharacterized protein n=1 Tax=Methanoculleus marisnigri TaxID=2198 RepID=A0A101GMS5_9EURY|nr:MAG: hypothetical protein XD82_1183 [Methanoculleus marisnigri]
MQVASAPDGTIYIDGKVVTALDRFVASVTEIIERYTRYVIISGYVAILFGRERLQVRGSSMELRFDREKNRQERLAFVRRHALWVREVPNEVWSREQADLIDAFFENAQNFALSRSEYLRMHRVARHRPEPVHG